MSPEPKRKGYRLHAIDSAEGRAELARQGLTRADLEQALAAFEQAEATRLRMMLGVSVDGVFGSTREDWHPRTSTEPLIAIPWEQILELLGRMPEGTTARLLAGAQPRDK